MPQSCSEHEPVSRAVFAFHGETDILFREALRV